MKKEVEFFEQLNEAVKIKKTKAIYTVKPCMSISLKEAEFDQINNILTIHESQLTNSINDTLVVQLRNENIEQVTTGGDKVRTYNPLVILLGVSEFANKKLSTLHGVKYDMIALRRLFQQHMGLTVVHENNQMVWRKNDILKLWQRAITRLIDIRNNN
eukprot:313_1